MGGKTAENQPQAADGFIVPLALTMKDFPRLTALCAEPCMGKTYLASRIVREARHQGRQTFQCSFNQELDAKVAKKFVRRCHDIRARMDPSKDPLVVIDGLAPADEAEARSEAQAIDRLVSRGAQVILCLRPEAEQLIERLQDVVRIGSDELLFRGDEESEAFALTGGIPSLVMGRKADLVLGERGRRLGLRYMAALKVLVRESLRASISREELRVRLAMVILGHATLEDIALVAGRCDIEQLLWLERDAPLFGVDAHEGTCRCRGLCLDSVFEGCLGTLQAIAATEPELVMRACGVLATMGEVRRSAIACRLCASEGDFTAVCVTWGVSYVGIGEAMLVDEALRAVQFGDGPRDTRALLSKAAVTCVLGTAREVDDAFGELEGILLSTTAESRLYRAVQLYGACREVLRNPREASRHLASDASDAMALACLDHLKVARLLVAGKFGEAYSTISNEMLMGDPDCLPEAFLCDDLKMALALSGGTADVKEQYLFDRAELVYARSGMRGLRTYHDALSAAAQILMSDGVDADPLVEAAGRAERYGDAFFQAVCLAIASVADVRMRALSRAHVRASKAADICRSLGVPYLASSAELVNALALELLGEPGAIGQFCATEGHPEELALIGAMVARAVGEPIESGSAAIVPTDTPCPRDALWALNLLASGCRDIWQSLLGIIPSTWVELLRAVRYRRERDEGRDTPALEQSTMAHLGREGRALLRKGEQMEIAPSEHKSGRLRVSVLGGFSVECEGRHAPEGAFERRRARDLVTLLAVVPGHRLRRYQAIETLWPQADYYRGPRKLYEATGEARARLAEVCSREVNPIVADRTQGSIGFDVSLVSCDVDDFEAEARMTLAEDGDDFWVLEHARRMERIYASGPDEHLAVLGELVVHRLEELRTLYVDGAVAAGEAALRLGKSKLAVRYGSDAHRLGDLREDAMILLVRSLKAAGRGFEIAELYRRYSQRLIEVKGVPPSMALRRVVEQALGSGPDALPI